MKVWNLAQTHHIVQHPVAEAPACRLKKLAQAAIVEAGDSLSTKVLERAANTKCLRNAERDLHNLFRKEGMVIPVHPETVRLGKVDLPLIYLRTWFQYLLGAHPEYLLGGFQRDQSAQLLLTTYWDNMEHIMPDHSVFSMFDRETWSRCIPFYLHMDEGVSQRKRAILVIAAQGCFGLNTADRYREAYKLAGVRSCDDAAKCMSGAQFHCSKGSTYKSRFLFTAIPKKNYTKTNDAVYHGILRLLAEECCSLMQSGVRCNGTTYYPICMGLKGDGPALGKAGYFTRYFASMGKDRGCCHECLAGCVGIPFEDCRPVAAWVSTIGLQVPWREDRVSPLSQIPGQKESPETFYKPDPFHIYKQSLGGYFVSNSIVLISVDLGLFTAPGQSTAVQNVLDRAYADFEFFVKHEWRGKSINHVKAFTKEIFHFAKLDSYPSARFKGSDCMMLVRWLKHLVLNGPVDSDYLMRTGQNLLIQPRKPFEAQVFAEILKGSAGAAQFFHILHTEGMWLACPVAELLATSCEDVCLSYASLAKLCFEKGLTRFRLEPCLHHFAHFGANMRKQISDKCPYMFNAASHLCEADEDFVGKISRGSRKVHAKSMTRRILDRYLLKLWFEFST